MYTLHDTPGDVARVESDLAAVVQAVRAADPALRSLVLTGGFARGEGAVLAGQPQNDYDFVAVRGRGRLREPYGDVAKRLEATLGLHIDLASVAAWRMRFVSPTIFWYETALRGRVLWGEDLLARIPVRSPAGLDRAEGLRLLVNRAAGLLLATGSTDAGWRRIQASKALLAALDAHLLAAGAFAPSQRERWARYELLRSQSAEPAALRPLHPWLEWAFRVKVDPGAAPARDGAAAWSAARHAIHDAVPAALRHAGLPSLEAYAILDGWADRAVWWRRSAAVPGARRLATHPTGRVRVATLRLLEDAQDGRIELESAWRRLADLAERADDPVRLLDGLRRATLQ
jgi:hypothetical protein